MPQNFLECDRDQVFLMPPDPRDWLPEGHLAWFVLESVEQMDLAAFYASYRLDGWGRAAFEPQLMVSLLLYAYARGERSSRAIERRCVEDVAYRVIAAHQTPDHATIARFRVRHEESLADLFSSVLSLCKEAGLVKVGLIAIDGTKLHANASHHCNLDYEQLAREILKEAAEVDAAEDELFGDARGDELPPEFQSTGELRKRLREAKQRLDAKRAAEKTPVPRSRPKRLKESRKRLDQELELERRVRADYQAWRARGISADGRRFGGREPRLEPLPEQPRGKINTTDPDSRNVKTPRSYTQGYNAQAVVNEHQIVLAAEVTVSSPDFGQLQPMVQATRRELEAIGVTEAPGVAVADTGYWHEDQIDNVVSNGTQVLIPPDAGKRDTPRPGWQGGRYTWMRNVLATDYGGGLYRRRKAIVEPVFAQTKHNRRIDRFQRRGRSAARSEWRLITATHNLMKLHKHQLAAAAA
jgi:transposase